MGEGLGESIQVRLSKLGPELMNLCHLLLAPPPTWGTRAAMRRGDSVSGVRVLFGMGTPHPNLRALPATVPCSDQAGSCTAQLSTSLSGSSWWKLTHRTPQDRGGPELSSCCLQGQGHDPNTS